MSRGTTARNVRVDDELWRAAKKRATAELTISDVIREALKAWLGEPDARYELFTPPPPRPDGQATAHR